MQQTPSELSGLTNKEKEIYNHYLKALAEASGRPYKKRINFDNFKPADYEALKKLALFFNKYKHIYPFNFFRANFSITGEKYLQLDYFNKYKSIANYSKYNSARYELSADSDESINSFVEGVDFICSFLKKNKLKLSDYRTCVNQYTVPWFIIHLKAQRISFYHLHAFGIKLIQIPEDYKELVCSSFDEKFNKTLGTYMTSNRLKQLGNEISEQSRTK